MQEELILLFFPRPDPVWLSHRYSARVLMAQQRCALCFGTCLAGTGVCVWDGKTW